MKSLNSILVIVINILLIHGSVALAETNYISGIQKVTFRSGPGTDNKIIKMLATDEKVTLIEAGETWSKVKDKDGVEGHVLNRFITKAIPAINKFNYIKRKHDKLKTKSESVQTENKTLKEVIADLQKKLKTSQSSLSETQKSFTELETGSADYIGLKKRHEKTLLSLKEKTKRVTKLEEQTNVYYIKWFLAGGGVLLLGWIIGLISRKKKSYSGIRL